MRKGVYQASYNLPVVHRALGYLNAFRLGLAVIILAVVFSPVGAELAPLYKFYLARAAALTYLASALVFLILHLRRMLVATDLAAFSLATDLVIITIVLHCFGGLESGLAILLLFTVGVSALLLPLRIALFFAAMVSLALIGEAIVAMQTESGSSAALQAGLYGTASFVTALGCSLLGRWGREYQLLAERRGLDLANLAQVNELIIQRMRSGVLVVDRQNRVRQMNEAAWYLLGNPPASQRNLQTMTPALTERLERWRKKGKTEDEALLLQATQVAVVPQFLKLPGIEGEGTLIFLEDTSVVSRRARDLAQASLARLSASISHEIRNPLGALSHAAQLLNESEALTATDRRLVEIIHNHSARMNDIVENVLKLSRRERARPEQVNIVTWTRRLAREFRRQHKLPDHRVRVESPPAGILVLIDPVQLTQAVWNLMENALKHAVVDDKPPTVTLRLSPIRGHREIALDIIDDGPGIPLEKRSQIFEPFFTTHKQGSGLGLYLARQMCDANQAPLEYVQVANAGACFRILLRRPEVDETAQAHPSHPAAVESATGTY